ncbi:MAG TPA: PQQ-binding-like beta-propeller repeat protein [Patescibacteria group bacterium]|nr:PQQ-binding-like beta-propeller repeat protein [Patescibacteria group bacterium]
MVKKMLRMFVFFAAAAMLPSPVSWGSDWPQFLGPHRNGVYDGTDLAEDWPSAGPRVAWQKNVGHGFSAPVVVGDKLILFSRGGNEETITCFNARTGEQVWNSGYPTTYEDDFGFDNGPRATPAISDGRVYTFGALGMLSCIDLATGNKVWSVDVKAMFQPYKGFFGMACSPLVEGKGVLLNPGGLKGAGIVAFDRSNGKLLWKSSDDWASYSSPVAANLGGHRYALFVTRNGFLAVDPVSGQVRYHYPWAARNRMSVTAATPLVIGENIFLSACYGTGAILLRLGQTDVEKLWSEDDLLSNHYATSVEFNGYLYGIHGRTDPGFNPHPRMRCIDLKTRKVCWETDSIGAASITRAGSRLLVLTEKGELVDVAATPEGFQSKGRVQALSEQVRAFPAVANGLFYAHNKDQLVCLDLRGVNTK